MATLRMVPICHLSIAKEASLNDFYINLVLDESQTLGGIRKDTGCVQYV